MISKASTLVAGALAVAALAHLTAAVAARAAAPPQPALCRPAEVSGVVERYVEEFNRAAFRTLDRQVFAQEPEFEWYSSGGPGRRIGAASRNRATLVPYLRRRWAAGDRLRLVSLQVNGNSRPRAAAPYGNFEFRLIRHPGERARVGKGAAFCYRGHADRIIVWSMGDAPS